jgi:hypothetical protein
MTNPPNTPPPPSRTHGAANNKTFSCSAGETTDSYVGVLCHFSERWRLALAADNSQWIFQYLESSHDAPWRGAKYFTTKKALLAAHGVLKLPYDGKVAEILDALPEHVSQLAKK